MKTEILDLERLLCPMPVIRVQDKIATLQTGDIVKAVCTDAGVKHDIPAWCRINGHEVLNIEEADGFYTITVKVGE